MGNSQSNDAGHVRDGKENGQGESSTKRKIDFWRSLFPKKDTSSRPKSNRDRIEPLSQDISSAYNLISEHQYVLPRLGYSTNRFANEFYRSIEAQQRAWAAYREKLPNRKEMITNLEGTSKRLLVMSKRLELYLQGQRPEVVGGLWDNEEISHSTINSEIRDSDSFLEVERLFKKIDSEPLLDHDAMSKNYKRRYKTALSDDDIVTWVESEIENPQGFCCRSEIDVKEKVFHSFDNKRSKNDKPIEIEGTESMNISDIQVLQSIDFLKSKNINTENYEFNKIMEGPILNDDFLDKISPLVPEMGRREFTENDQEYYDILDTTLGKSKIWFLKRYYKEQKVASIIVTRGKGDKAIDNVIYNLRKKHDCEVYELKAVKILKNNKPNTQIESNIASTSASKQKRFVIE